MKSEKNRIDELHDQLSQLLAKDVSSKDKLRDWYLDARHVQDSLTDSEGLGSAVPELIWHYLADADIRSKDSTYRTQQESFVRAFLKLMEKGEIPSEKSILAYLEETRGQGPH